MTRSTDVMYACACGISYPTTIYHTVNVTLEPSLLYMLLAGALNTSICPNCARKAHHAQPFIYHDMTRGLFAYVHPRADASDEEREAVLDHLRKAYSQAVEASGRILRARPNPSASANPKVHRRTPGEDLARQIEPETPPMQVIFGVEQLIALVGSLLEPDNRLAKMSLSTPSADAADRQRLLSLARQIAAGVDCYIEPCDTADDYSVWFYGPRARIEAMSAAINTDRRDTPRPRA